MTISTIKPAGGGDYTTIQAWEDALGSGEQQAECYRGGDLGGLWLNDAAPDSVEIYSAAGHQHNGTISQGTTGIAHADSGWTIQRSDVTVRGMRIGASSGIPLNILLTIGSASNIIAENNLIDGRNVGVGMQAMASDSIVSAVVVRNNVVYGGDVGSRCLRVFANASSGNASMTIDPHNNTFVSEVGSVGSVGQEALAAANPGLTAEITANTQNTVAMGGSIADFFEKLFGGGGTEIINGTYNHNASSDGTADDFGGSGNLVDQFAEDWFVDPATDLRLKAGSPGIDAGTTIASVTTDFRGIYRPQGTAYDIGFFEFVKEPTAAEVDALFDDPSSLVSFIGYDSRSNRTLRVDPKANTTVTVFDGASRPTQVQPFLRQRGQGENAPAPNTTFLAYGGATIRSVTRDYDGNGRTTRLVDDNGNQTLYQYDTLDRQTQLKYMDGSTRDYVYNEASDVTTYTDENGSEFDNTFDALGRKLQCDITPASGVLGTDQQTFQYDGLSRMTFCRDSISSTHADVNLFYDSLSRVIEDSQVYGGNMRSATYEAFESYPVTQMAFPDGRQTTNEYDDLYRRVLVEETSGGADIAAWEFFGLSRVAEVTLGNGLICSHLNNDRTRSAAQEGQTSPGWGDDSSDRLGYDGAARMITKRYVGGGINGTTHAYNNSTAVVGQTTAYDKASNKLYERSLQAASRSSLYEPFDANGNAEGGYDSLDRLRQYQRGILSDGVSPNPTPPGGSVTSPISLPGTDESRDYNLDGLGNWRRTTFDPVGSSEETQIRQHNSLNEITSTKDGSDPKVDLTYDGVTGASNGNLADDGVRSYEWDALNRLKKVYKTPSSPVLIGEYTYDALGRRIRKVITNGGLSGSIPNGTTDFLYHSGISQCCEERDGSDDPFKQYVWGIYIDELLQQKTFTTINGNAAGDYYPLSDTLYRTVALTDDAGDIVETYDTDAYGNTLIFTAAGTGGNWWADDAVTGDNPICEFIFTGRRYDAETTMYFYRRRYYYPSIGRFLSRDPMQLAEREINLYQYVVSKPETTTDPMGTQPVPVPIPQQPPITPHEFPRIYRPPASPAGCSVSASLLGSAVGGIGIGPLYPTDLGDAERPRLRGWCRERHPDWPVCRNLTNSYSAAALKFVKAECGDHWKLYSCAPVQGHNPPGCPNRIGTTYHCSVEYRTTFRSHFGWGVEKEGWRKAGWQYRVSVACCLCCTRETNVESEYCLEDRVHWSSQSNGQPPPECR